jgi:hypothetical protein
LPKYSRRTGSPRTRCRSSMTAAYISANRWQLGCSMAMVKHRRPPA